MAEAKRRGDQVKSAREELVKLQKIRYDLFNSVEERDPLLKRAIEAINIEDWDDYSKEDKQKLKDDLDKAYSGVQIYVTHRLQMGGYIAQEERLTALINSSEWGQLTKKVKR